MNKVISVSMFTYLGRKKGNAFLRGMGSILSISPRKGWRMTPEEAFAHDMAALRSDWETIGNDMWDTMHQFSRANNLPSPEELVQKELPLESK